MNKTKTKNISVTAMLTALAFLLTFVFRFKVAFLTFDFKDSIISIASLLFGPLYGVASAIIVAFIEFISVSDTGIYGLIMNFASSATFALAIGTVYKYKRSFSGAIIACVTAVISVSVVMMLANIIVTPFYMGVTTAEVIAQIPTLLLPFNFTKAVMNATALLIIYKPFTTALKKAGLVKTSGDAKYQLGFKTIMLMSVSVIVFIAAVLFLIFVLKGQFTLFK